jgi:hypothetical protein
MPEERLAKLSPRERYLLESESSFAQAESLLNTPIFVNHGDVDQSVDVNQSRYVVRMLQRWGYDIRYREHPGKGHGGLNNDDETVAWFLQHERDPHPRQVRVRAAELRSASAYWVRIDQRADQREFMIADAEVAGPNAIRLDTRNVLAITLSPPSTLVDPARPIRVFWNGSTARTVSLRDGHVTLQAEGHLPAAGQKTASIAGPIADVMQAPFAVVVGTIAEDGMTRELCNRKARELVEFWKGWQHQPIRLYKDTEIPDAEVARYSLILIGGMEANAVTRRLSASLPLTISGDEISIDGRSFKAPDAAVMMAYPHPLNPERHVLVAAASSPAGMYFLDLLGSGQGGVFDFVITDGAVANSRRGRPVDKVRVAAGLFDNNWHITDALLDRADPEIRAKCPRRQVRPDLTTTLTGLPVLTAEAYDAYAGEYQAGTTVFAVTKEGNRLVARVPNQPALPLIPESETEFTIEGADVQLTFVRDPGGKVSGVNVQPPNQDSFPATKIK